MDLVYDALFSSQIGCVKTELRIFENQSFSSLHLSIHLRVIRLNTRSSHSEFSTKWKLNGSSSRLKKPTSRPFRNFERMSLLFFFQFLLIITHALLLLHVLLNINDNDTCYTSDAPTNSQVAIHRGPWQIATSFGEMTMPIDLCF